MAYDNELSGCLFKNDQKGNTKAPWYKGFCEIKGIKYEVAAWIKESKKDGSKFLSLKFTAPDEQREYTPAPAQEDYPAF